MLKITKLTPMGLSNQYLNYFQKPYSFEAQSEPTIEIIDAPIVLDIESKPEVRNQVGRTVATDENVSTGNPQISNTVLTPAEGVDFSKSSTSQWTQTIVPQTGPTFDLFATSTGMLYTVSPTGIYRLPAGATTWMPVNIAASIKGNRMPMAEYEGTSYIVATDEIVASTDGGETWKAFCPRPRGQAVGLIVTHETRSNNSQIDIAMYLAFEDKGVFRSTDTGTHWIPFNNGLTDKRISAVAAIGNTLFAGTNRGLYRFDSDVWQQLPVAPSETIHSLEVMKNDLYIGISPNFSTLKPRELNSQTMQQVVPVGSSDSKRIFHSADLGETWTEITPTSRSLFMRFPSGIKISIVEEALLVTGTANFYSTDRGQTWTSLGVDPNSFMVSRFPVVAVDERTFYKAGGFGIHRTVDGGKSWHPFMDGIVGTRILNLVVFNNRLYAHLGNDIAQSTDGGESWKVIGKDVNDRTFESIGEQQPRFDFSLHSKLVVAGGILYGIVPEAGNVRVFHLSVERNEFIPIQSIPAFEREARPNGVEKGEQFTTILNTITDFTKISAFTVSGKTFYAEYKRKLFKWELGDAEWKDTGLMDTGKQPNEDLNNELKLAVSGKVVYVGKRDGKLFQSLDGGASWRDVTSSLPLSFTHFKEIVFAGSTVYVATDKGVLSSQTGAHWRVLTDGTGERIVIDRFAIDHTRVYGAGDTGVYHLDAHDKWEQISPSVPGKVLSLVIDRNRLYVLTQQLRMFHISLEEGNYALSHK